MTVTSDRSWSRPQVFKTEHPSGPTYTIRPDLNTTSFRVSVPPVRTVPPFMIIVSICKHFFSAACKIGIINENCIIIHAAKPF